MAEQAITGAMIRCAQDARKVIRQQNAGRKRAAEKPAALPLHRYMAADQRLRGGAAKADDDFRSHRLELPR